MRVHRIALRHYRGVEAVEVELDPTGVTVIEGPNGVGKTSLVEALAVGLGTAETSRSRAVMALQPVGEDVAPEIELDVESGAYRFTLSKGYLKRPRATLRVVAPRDETLAGGQVHDRVNEILDLSGVDRNLLRSLWVHQGGEMAQVGLKECPSLGRALDEAAGQTPSGELEESVLDRVRKEASRFLTPGGAELKWLSDLRTAVSRAEKELVEARSIEQSLQEQMERSERAASGLAALGEQLDALRSAARAHERALAELEHQEQAVELAAQRAHSSAAFAHLAEERRLNRAAIIAELEGARARLEEAQELLAGAQAREAPLQESLLDAQAEVRRAVQEWQSRSAERRLRQGDVAQLRRADDLRLLEERRRALDEARRDRAAALAVIEAIPVTDQLMDLLRTLELEVKMAAARREAAGATVTFTAVGDLRLEYQGSRTRILSGETSEFTVTDEVGRFDLADQAVITVTPGVGALAEKERAEDAAARFQEQLSALGLQTMSQAESALRDRAQAESDLALAEAALERAQEGCSAEELDQQMARLRAEVSVYLSSRSAAEQIPGDLQAAGVLLAAAERQEQDSEQSRTRAEQVLEVHRRAVEEVQSELQQARARATQAHLEVARLEQQLQRARATGADDAVEAEFTEARRLESLHADELARAQAALEGAQPDVVRSLAANAAAALARAEAEMSELRALGVRADAQIEVLAPRGLFDQTKRKEHELERASDELNRQVRAAQAAKALLTAMEDSRSRARLSYLAPLREQIESRGRVVFGPDFTAELDQETLQVVGCRVGARFLTWDRLSTGTQEQLAIIVRLAAAYLAAPQGGVPLIIDDALGYSDEDRLERMCALLGRVGREVQVIILTCMPRRYLQVGGARTIRLDGGHPRREER